ncbi:MAG: superoxide dismutase [Candidatus Methanomethyliaceae archaeon]|nr:superoxide dismutase [Candidatus Methanomethyliaceae archaeon]
MEKKVYSLPSLPYAYNALAPQISEEQLKIHHTKHHQAYVDNVNNINKKFDDATKSGADIDLKALLKELAFNLGGHALHSYFWEDMAPSGKGGGKPGGKLADQINEDFGSLDRFKKLFSQTATSVEGSGWASLIYDGELDRLMLQQIEKHNVNYAPDFTAVMVLDVWEHAYYIDYKNLRAKFVEVFWNVVNWDGIGKWFEEIKSWY